MSGLPFGTDTLTVERAATVADLGSTYQDWDDPDTHDVDGCVIQGGDTTEEHDREDAQIAAFTVWAPIDADITGEDRVRFVYAGRTYSDYQVLGEPKPLVDPTGALSHLTVRLQKREG